MALSLLGASAREASPCSPAMLGAALERRMASDFSGAAAALASLEGAEAEPGDSPLSPWCAFFRGDALFWAGDFALAAQSFAAARALDPDGPAGERALSREAQARFEARELEAATGLLEEALRARPGPELLLLLADAFEARGERAKAVVHWRRVYVDFPDHPAARAAGLKLKRCARASAALSAGDHLARASRLLAVGLGKKALASAHRALFSAPDEIGRQRAQLAIAKARAALKDVAEAERIALGVWSGPAPPSLQVEAGLLLGRLALSRGAAEEAAARLSAIARRFPSEPDAAEAGFLAAWTFFNVGDFAECARRMASFLEAGRAGKRGSEALWYAGYCSHRAGDRTGARTYLAALEQTSAALAPQALYWLGREAPSPREAQARYRAVIRRAPASWYAWLSRQRLQEAGASAEPFALAATEPTAPTPRNDHERRAQILARLGLTREAHAEVDYLARRATDPADASRVARLCLGLGLYDRAYAIANARLWPSAFERGEPEALALLYPRAYPEAVRSAALAVALDPYFAWAIMRRESAFDTQALSSARAFGLMQLLAPTARKIALLAGEERPDLKALQQPERILPLATWYLADLAGRFGHAALAAAAYNGSPQAVARWVAERADAPLDEFVEQIPYRETRLYVKGVLSDYFTYRALWKADGEPLPFPATVPRPKEGVSF